MKKKKRKKVGCLKKKEKGCRLQTDRRRNCPDLVSLQGIFQMVELRALLAIFFLWSEQVGNCVCIWLTCALRKSLQRHMITNPGVLQSTGLPSGPQPEAKPVHHS